MFPLVIAVFNLNKCFNSASLHPILKAFRIILNSIFLLMQLDLKVTVSDLPNTFRRYRVDPSYNVNSCTLSFFFGAGFSFQFTL